MGSRSEIYYYGCGSDIPRLPGYMPIIRLDQLKYGDILYRTAKCNLFFHAALFIDCERIIDFYSLNPYFTSFIDENRKSCNKDWNSVVRIITLKEYLRENNIDYVRRLIHDAKCDKDEINLRLKRKIGEKLEWRLFDWNCEHFSLSLVIQPEYKLITQTTVCFTAAKSEGDIKINMIEEMMEDKFSEFYVVDNRRC